MFPAQAGVIRLRAFLAGFSAMFPTQAGMTCRLSGVITSKVAQPSMVGVAQVVVAVTVWSLEETLTPRSKDIITMTAQTT